MNNSTINTESVSITEIRECLREAGFLDPTLSEREMVELYEVLNNSKSTASKEDEQRRILEQTEKNCSMIEDMRRNSVPVYRNKENEVKLSDSLMSSSQLEDDKRYEDETSNQNEMVEEEISSITVPTQHNQNKELVQSKHSLEVFSSVPTSHRSLKRINIKPLYKPPFYCDPKLMDMNEEKRAHYIAEYHLKLLRNYDNYQRQSLCPAPWGKVIQANARFNGNLLRKVEVTPDDDGDDDDAQNAILPRNDDKNSEDDFEVYVSQSGRQTKRKLYTEDSDSNEPKKNKFSVNNDSTKKIQARKRLGTLNNEEIMKRSKLFADNDAPTRTEKMFDKLAEEEKKKKAAEKEAEKFQETLDQLSDKEKSQDILDIAEIVHSEEPFIRRRVVPPSHVKKQAGRAVTKLAGRGRGKKAAVTKEVPENVPKEVGSPKYNPLEISTKVKTNPQKETGTCPMCNLMFPLSELEEHASGCEDSYCDRITSSAAVTTTTTTSNKKYSQQKQISCENCDTVLPLDEDYEVHVIECLSKARHSSSKIV